MTRLANRPCVILLGIALLMPLAPAVAQMRQVPIPGSADPRVQTVLFQEDTVVALRGHYGYQMTVEFGADERIENVSIGDSLAWQVTPNRRADTLFIKPIEFDAATNMSVITSKRRYTFQLSAEEPSGPGDPAIIYRVKFTYPPEPTTDASPQEGPLVVPANANSNYSVSGSPRNIPARIYDDGVKTYMEWPGNASTPAVFALGVDGAEAVVNFIMRGNLMVVERVGPAFVLRNGNDQTLVTNDAWSEPVPGPNAPSVRNGNKAATSPARGLFNWGRSKKKAGS
jgi:type IV secretion system protein VirB9